MNTLSLERGEGAIWGGISRGGVEAVPGWGRHRWRGRALTHKIGRVMEWLLCRWDWRHNQSVVGQVISIHSFWLS